MVSLIVQQVDEWNWSVSYLLAANPLLQIKFYVELRYETDKSATTLAEGGMEESKNYKF